MRLSCLTPNQNKPRVYRKRRPNLRRQLETNKASVICGATHQVQCGVNEHLS